MPTYDAGSLRASADLNRDPFIEGLRACLREGRDFARQVFTATARVDAVNARRELAQLQLMMRRISEESVDIDVNINSTAARVRLAELRAEQARYRAEVAASKEQQARWNAQLGESRVRLEEQRQGSTRAKAALEEQRAATVRARQALNESRSAWRDYERQQGTATRTMQRATQASKEQHKEFSLLRVAIEQLGPPLVPIAGGLLAAGSALAGLGVAGILAVKGITAEYKAGTPLGLQYAGMLRTVNSEVGVLQHTAASGVLDGLERGVNRSLVYLPAFNREVRTSSRNLGDIVAHLAGGAVGGFVTFAPLIHEVEGDVDRLASRFEAWATGPGGTQFAATLTDDYAHLRDFLGQLFPALEHVLSAVNPLGTTMLDNLTMLSSIISHIPVPVLEASATAYIAYRTALLVTTPLTAAAKALDGLRASQLATAASTTALSRTQGAAAAGEWGSTTLYRNGQAMAAGGSAARIAAATRAVIPYAAAWVGATIAINSASSATAQWRREADQAKSTIANTLHAAGSLLTLNMGGFSQARRDQNAARQNAADQRSAQSQLNQMGLGTRPVTSSLAQSQQLGIRYEQFSALGAADVVTRNAAAMGRARAEWQAGVSTLHALTAAGADQGAQFQALEARTAAAALAYHALRGQVDDYARSLHQQNAAQASTNRRASAVRDSYAGGQAAYLSGVQTQALAQSPTVTSGIASLQKYNDAVSTAVKNEKAWAETTSHNTVEIRGHHFALDAWRKAVDQANGDTTKAAGILLGHRKALNDDRVAADLAAAQQNRLTSAVGAAERKYALNDQQLNLYAATVGITAGKLADGTVSQTEFLTVIGRVKGVIDSANTATAGWVAALTQFSSGTDTAASRAGLLEAAMISFNGVNISYGLTMSNAAAANQAFVDAFDKADKGVVKAKRGLIDYTRAGAQPVLAALQQLQQAAGDAAAATYQNEVSTKGRTQAAKDAAAVYRNDTYNALIGERKQLHLTRDEAEKLANRYFHWPKDAKTRLELMGTEGTNKLLNGIGEQLALLTGKPWISTIDADNRSAKGKIADLNAEIARIGKGQVPHLTVDNAAGRAKIAELLNDIANLRAQALVHVRVVYSKPGSPTGTKQASAAGGGLFHAYAGGGIENHWPTIAKTQPGTVRIWAEPETKGEAYIPLADDWRRPQAREIASQTVAMLGGVAFFAAGGGPGGYTGVTAPSSGSGAKPGGSTSHSGSSSTAGSTSNLNALRTLARQVAADALGLKTFRELDKLSSATLQSYADGLLKQVQRGQDLKAVPSALVKRVKAETGALRTELKTRDYLLAQKQRTDAALATARSNFNAEVSTVSQASMSGFDITQSGQGYAYGIKASLDQQLASVQRFGADLVQARKMKLTPSLVQAFAEAGPSSMNNLEAIINAGQKYVTDISGEYGQLAATARSTGVAEANQMGLGTKVDEALAAAQKVNERVAANTATTNHTLRQLRGDIKTLAGDIKDARRANGGKR